jgi:hypothetical protein
MSMQEKGEQCETPALRPRMSQIGPSESSGQVVYLPKQGRTGEPIIYAGMPRDGSVEYLLGGLRFDPSVPCLYRLDTDKARKAAEIPVHPQPSDRALRLLRLLVERKGQVVSYDDIFAEVWRLPPRCMDTSNIHVLVGELRKILGRPSIENLRMCGYRITLEVVVIERPRLTAAEDEKTVTAGCWVSPERLQEWIKAAVTDAFAALAERMGDLTAGPACPQSEDLSQTVA